MRGLTILVDGFEDTEALTTIDVLRRAKIDIDTVSLDKKEIQTQSNNVIYVPYLLKDKKIENYDFLFLPGGKAVFNILDKDKRVDEVIDYFFKNNKLICAICAAPRLVAKRGYFKDHDFTSFPGSVDFKCLGNIKSEGVVKSGNFITAKSMYYTIDFALTIVQKLLGEEQKEKVYHQLRGEI